MSPLNMLLLVDTETSEALPAEEAPRVAAECVEGAMEKLGAGAKGKGDA